MPLYEYQCQSCRRRVEKIQKFSDAPLTTCPHCGGSLERTLTAPAVQFKGSGWYKDLYSSAKPAASAGSGEGGGGTAAAGGYKGTPGSGGGEKAPSSSSAPGTSASNSPASGSSSAAPASSSGS